MADRKIWKISRRGLRLIDLSFFASPWQWTAKRGANRTVLVELLRVNCSARMEVADCVGQDVERLGEEGDRVLVKPGHMRHDLYPNKQAIYAPYNATPSIKEKKYKEIPKPTKEETVKSQLSMVLDRLTKASLEIRRPLKEGEPENTPITAEIVCMFVQQRLGIELAAELLDMPLPLQRSGEHEIPLKFSYQGETDLALKLKITDKSETEKES